MTLLDVIMLTLLFTDVWSVTTIMVTWLGLKSIRAVFKALLFFKVIS